MFPLSLAVQQSYFKFTAHFYQSAALQGALSYGEKVTMWHDIHFEGCYPVDIQIFVQQEFQKMVMVCTQICNDWANLKPCGGEG